MSLPDIGFAMDALPVTLTRDMVIEFFDGDRIVLLRSGAKDPYLQVWVNTDGTVTRWIILRISDHDLGRFLHADATLQELIANARDGHVYVLDTSGGSTVRVAFLRVRDIPPEDMPTDESYYDASLTPTCADNMPKEQLVLLDGEWSGADLAAWERTYTQVYVYNALLGTTSSANVAALRDRFMNYRFVGSGWSHATAAEQVADLMSREAKPKFKSVQLSSPGAVRYSVDSTYAASVRASLRTLWMHADEIEKRYNDLHQRLLEINRAAREIEKGERPLDASEVLAASYEDIKSAAYRLAELMGQIDPNKVWLVAGTDLNGGELIANYYRRLATLRADEKKGRAIVV